ncbi:hypothetical protein Bbelb_285800 [Branchiostoma belcheri]|nr:hypothetical protein Bbelb_285800 [Branchiostoma belcheri]
MVGLGSNGDERLSALQYVSCLWFDNKSWVFGGLGGQSRRQSETETACEKVTEKTVPAHRLPRATTRGGSEPVSVEPQERKDVDRDQSGAGRDPETSARDQGKTPDGRRTEPRAGQRQ